MKIEKKDAQRMSPKVTLNLISNLLPQIEKDFAGVRGRVQRAVEASPRSVTLAAAIKQIRLFSAATSNPSSEAR